MPPVTGPFPYDRLLRELELKDEASERPRDKASVSKTCDSPQSSKAYDEARIGAGIVTMAVSLPWLAFAVFHSPFLTAFFATTTLLSGAVLVGPERIQAATRNLKEVFRAAANKIRASSPAEKSRSNTIQPQPSQVGLRHTPRDGAVKNVQYYLRKEFRTADVSVEERIQHLENIASDLRRQVEDVTKEISDHISVRKLDKPRFSRPTKKQPITEC